MITHELSIADGQFDGFREQQSLGGGVTLFHALEHLLVKHAFVGRMLIHEYESAIGFEHDIKASNDADQSERNMEEGEVFVRGGLALRGGG